MNRLLADVDAILLSAVGLLVALGLVLGVWDRIGAVTS